MAKKEQHLINPEKIHLLKIEEVETSISKLVLEEDSKEVFDFKLAHLSAYNLDDKRFLFGLEIVFWMKNREPECLARFRYDFHFSVENLENMYNLDEDGNPFFKQIFVGTLAGISYSTLRGIILEKLNNSSWPAFVLPVLNPTKILDSWIETT